MGPSLAGTGLGVTALVTGHLIVSRGAPGTALLFAALASATLATVMRWLTTRGPLSLNLLRSSSTNLIAVPRGDATPATWLVAHLDSKAQTIPMLVRMCAVTLFILLFAGLVLVAGVVWVIDLREAATVQLRPDLAEAAAALAIGAAIATIPLVLCFVGDESPGALDNATGVAAVILAAEALAGRTPVGVLLTSAEELALAGARAFAAEPRRTAVYVNCDTLDDSGRVVCMRTKRPSGRLESALKRAAARVGIPLGPALPGWPGIAGPMLPGVLADNVAFSDAGWDSVTVARGNLRTLARVHSRGDRAASLTGSGASAGAVLLAAIVEELA